MRQLKREVKIGNVTIGGKIVFLLIEAVTGHAVPEKIQSSLTVAAFALLFGLMLFATYNDIVRLVTGAV